MLIAIAIYSGGKKKDDSDTQELSNRKLNNFITAGLVAFIHMIIYVVAKNNTKVDAFIQLKHQFWQDIHYFNIIIIKLNNQEFGVSDFWKFKYVAKANL